ncbi:hypothetical protein DNHGIG_36350 [Collibacillus ludicampi]|jgi:outer membrane lipoprotein SlyB|uniref:Glycine zipper domain-containing protein n=1 Tax=Collibacillus ludicampi TaxID=2771369 RepID=A0AAV4LJQ0_9BACL|nr:hypothetical protein [Collibacillus ludicampi]GIM48086.1 hypothetical protein DNHGIG_36350 [Collibacillus ludicampi]
MFRGGSLWAGILSGGVSQFMNTVALSRGQLNRSDYVRHTTENVTGALGIMAGVEYGAVLGSTLMPGIGTIAGSLIGGIVGDRVGRMVGEKTGNLIVPSRGQANGEIQ